MKHKRGYYDVFVRTCAKCPSRVAVSLYKDGVYKKYTYSELYGVCEYISQNIQQLQYKRGVIGLISKRNIIIPCVIAAAHKCCTTFMFLDPAQDIKSVVDEIKFKIIIIINDATTGSTTELFGKKPDKTIEVFDLVLDFFNQEHSQQNKRQVAEHSFIAQTSGSSGEPKHIQVPLQSIQPNVDDLTKMFNITADDVIYFSTPLTFDPSMIEILLACMNGATLLIAPEEAEVLFPINKDNSVTFWQTTPSRFFQYSDADIRNKILSANSTLKILALGGEPLTGIRRLKELKDKNNKTRVFTLYGVTEMSCWACVAELNLETIQNDSEVPLGKCLSETQIVVESINKNNNTGKVVLVSKTRRCTILNKRKEEYSAKSIDTGDLAEVKHGTIYYRGRKDDVIKRFGNKVNLRVIESTITLCPRVQTSSCLWLPKPMLLVVYFSSEMLSSRELSDFLKCKLDQKFWPDKVIRVENMPMSPHGKVSKLILSKMFENTPQPLSEVTSIFLKELEETLSKDFSYDQIKNKHFFAIGGTSFLAVSMCNRLALQCPRLSKFILPHLMSETKTINEILELADKEGVLGKKSRKNKRAISNAGGSIPKKSASAYSTNTDNFIVLWTHDTGKCVDASPSLFLSGHHLYVTVGSHSGEIIVADATTGTLHGQLHIKSRVEASVLCYHRPPTPPVGVVGAYDGTVVCFTLQNSEELWRINVGSMIKSKAVCCNGMFYVAAYDGKIRCIDVSTGCIKRTIGIVEEAISADLVIAKNQFVLVATLSGACACVNTVTKNVAWRGLLGSPVFASPVLYDEDKYVVFAEVAGEIHCRTVEKGIKIWKYQGVKGNIFSSLYIKEVSHLQWQAVFGCHDDYIYSIYIKNFQPSLHWKTQMASQVYATPCGMGDTLILAVSTNGRICVIDSTNGNITAEYSLPGEAFSSPAVYGDYVFIGCRNDNVYCLKYTLDLYSYDFRAPK